MYYKVGKGFDGKRGVVVKRGPCKKGEKNRAGMMAGLYSLPSFCFFFYSDKSRVTIDFSLLLFVDFPPVSFPNGIVLDVVQMPIGGKG